MTLADCYPRLYTYMGRAARAPQGAYALVAHAGAPAEIVAAQFARMIRAGGGGCDSADLRTGVADGIAWCASDDGAPLGVSSVRHAIRAAHRAAQRNVVCITGKMTVQAQSALLKTLEEPPAHTTIILATDDSAHLLPTVRSRVQWLVVPRVATAAVEAFLAARNVADASVIAQLSHGAIATALALADDAALRALYAAAHDFVQHRAAVPLHERLALAARYADTRVRAAQFLRAVTQSMRACGAQAASLRALCTADSALSHTTASPRLILEDVLLRL